MHQIQTIFQIKQIAQLACSVCYAGVVLSKLLLNCKFFTLLLAKSNFHVSIFWFAIFNLLLFIYRSNFGYFLVSRWLILTFTLFRVRVGEFQFSHFQFSHFQFSRFQFSRFQFSYFCFSGFNFPASVGESNFHASNL
jgi:hypothetical protein